MAHTYRQDKIPNIMKYAFVNIDENILTLDEDCNLEYDEEGNIHNTLIVYDYEKNKIYLEIEEVIDTKNIKIKDLSNVKLDDTERVFIYGQNVNDFNCIDKSYIYTINVAATQEIDRQLQAEKEKVKQLRNELNEEKQKVSTLVEQVQNLLSWKKSFE